MKEFSEIIILLINKWSLRKEFYHHEKQKFAEPRDFTKML